MKEIYQNPEFELIEFDSSDIITVSAVNPDGLFDDEEDIVAWNSGYNS